MSSDRRGPARDRGFRLAILGIAAVACMSLAQEVLKPLALAGLLAFILAPAASWLQRRGAPRALAVAGVLGVGLGGLIAVAFAVGRQLIALANDLPRYQDRIDRKLGALASGPDGPMARASGVLRHVAEVLEGPATGRPPVPVRVVPEGSYLGRLEAAAGPSLEFLGVGSIVLILVAFLLLQREDMSDRIVRLFGRGRIGLTTRAMDDAGRRISRYLGAFSAVNAGYGLVVGLGLWAIGVPLPALWGALAGALRFIPYVGPAAAFALPMGLSVVAGEGWTQPVLVLLLFGALEVVAASVLEPILYGRTTGVSAVGLLVAALFWAWLWGPVGLLLSTPLTVCLAVAGKSLPGLGIFATLLGEEPALEEPMRLYQRLLADDREGARAVLDAARKDGPPERLFDAVLLPLLARADGDLARKAIDRDDRDRVGRGVDDFLDELEWSANLSPKLVAPGPGDGASPPGTILGVGVADPADVLALRMLNLLLAPWGRSLEIAAGPSAPGDLAALASARAPAAVVLSRMDPSGAASARRLAHRLREADPARPVLVGLWGGRAEEGPGEAASLASARDLLLASAVPDEEVVALLLRALIAGDDAPASHLFERVARGRPFEGLHATIIAPTLARAAEARAEGKISAAQEEAVSRFVRKALLPEANAVRHPRADAPRALVARPGGDDRDLGPMLLTLLLRGRGWDVLDLGDEVPSGRIAAAVSAFRPHLAVLCAGRRETADDLAGVASALADGRPGAPVVALAGAGFAGSAGGVPVLPDDPASRLQEIDRLMIAAGPSPG